VSFSGCHHNKEIRNKLKSFRHTCRDEARRYAFQLRIPEPIKVTTIAPTGTISLLPGTTSGCQPIFARHYKRLVNYAANDQNLKALADQGHPIEDSVYTPNTKVVTFFCKDPMVAECERRGIDLAMIEDQCEIEISDHMAVQAMLQDEYADNSISYTINFLDTKVKIEEVEAALKVHLPHLKGTTLMPENESRPQTPFQRITSAEFEAAEKRGIGKVSDKEMECLNGVCPVK
jgi:ribonucleoside-diphosphate reductase alpha chain